MAKAIGSSELARFLFEMTVVSSEVAPAADTEADFLLPAIADPSLAFPRFTLEFTALFMLGLVTAVAARVTFVVSPLT